MGSRRDVPFVASAPRAALGALALLALLGSSASGQTVRAGNLIVTVEGGFTPAQTAQERSGLDHPQRPQHDPHRRRNPPAGPRLPQARVRQAHRRLHQGPPGLHDRAAAEHRSPPQAKAALPERDHRQRPGRRRNRIPRTGALLRQGADGDLQRAAARTATRSSSSTSTPTCRRRRPSSPPRRSARPPGLYGTSVYIKVPTIVAGQGSLSFAELSIHKKWVDEGQGTDAALRHLSLRALLRARRTDLQGRLQNGRQSRAQLHAERLSAAQAAVAAASSSRAASSPR